MLIMKTFHINSTVQGCPATLNVEEIESPVHSRSACFRIRKGKKNLGLIKIDPDCNIIYTENKRETLNEQDMSRLCKEIFVSVKGHRPELTIFYS